MKTAGIFTLIAIIVIGIIWFVPDSNQLDPADNSTTTDEMAVEVPEDWQTYENDQFDFSFQYPAAATTTVEADRVKVQLIGPDSEPNTEITDGFTFYVHSEELGEATSTEAFARSYYEDQLEHMTVVEEPHEVSVAGKTGYAFILEGQNGSDTVYRVFPAGGDEVYITVSIVSDPNDEGYSDMVDTMTGTFQQ